MGKHGQKKHLEEITDYELIKKEKRKAVIGKVNYNGEKMEKYKKFWEAVDIEYTEK